MEKPVKVTKENVVDFIIEFEGGEISAPQVFELFSYLIKSGQAWTLQGSYGRAAKSLIEGGYLSKEGEILA